MIHVPERNLNIGKESILSHGVYLRTQLSVQIWETQSIKCFQNNWKELNDQKKMTF